MKTILGARNASPGNKNAKMSSALIDERGVVDARTGFMRSVQRAGVSNQCKMVAQQ